MMIIIGGVWLRYDVPVCGTSYGSARFSLQSFPSKGYRTLSGNACPGYDWRTQKAPYDAGDHSFSVRLPTQPRIAAQVTPIGLKSSSSVSGVIGFALNGVKIFSVATSSGEDSVLSKGSILDSCGGVNDPMKEFTFSTKVPGIYHYIAMPGDPNPLIHIPGIPVANISYCAASSSWYSEDSTTHSPIVGFLADGIPIYGPRGANGLPPQDLDQCGGHAGDDIPFYHYHFSTVYPYSVECLVGCPNTAINSQLPTSLCSIDPNTIQYDYAPIQSLSILYGGSGQNREVFTGPASLLAFGGFLLIVSVMWSCCICCNKFGIFNIEALPETVQSYERNIPDENIEDDYQFL